MVKVIKNKEWEIVPFDWERITNAVRLAAKSVNINLTEDTIKKILTDVIWKLNHQLHWVEDEKVLEVDDIQNAVEESLINENLPKVSKEYILYRNKRDELRKKEQELVWDKLRKHTLQVTKTNWTFEEYNEDKIRSVFRRVQVWLNVSEEDFMKEISKYLVDKIKTADLFRMMVKSAVDLISQENVDYQILAWRLNILDLYKQASITRRLDMESIYNANEFLKLMKEYVAEWLYYKDFLNPAKGWYTEEEVLELASNLNREFDFEYTFQSTMMMRKRYLLNPNKIIKELPQEMYLASAMFLWIQEKDRLNFVKKAYEYTSNQKISLPTPTLLNSRTNYHQLSSCFKLNVDDDLRAIYHSIENMAQISKFGGWIWVYLWNIRSRGWNIRWVKWAAGWVTPWVKVINDTAIAVNQLWARAWAISVTLDVFHRDIYHFLDLQTETGDIRWKSFDIFPSVSFPDLFMERVEQNASWTLFDPKEVEDVTWKRLQDHFNEDFNKFYVECENNPKLTLKETTNAKELYKEYLKVTVETGMPYSFFRDTANRLNPNKHAGNIYSTQLCVEIQQNTSPSEFIEETIVNEDWTSDKIRIEYKPWDLVVCNLASINVARVNTEEDMKEVIPVAMRILDNVITLNYYPIKEAELTSKKYRAVWLWFLWLAEYLAVNKIAYDSQEWIDETKKLFERYSYHTVKASVELSKERWAYELFKWSEWSKWIVFWKDANWFKENSEHSEEWIKLLSDMQEHWLRNWYLLAPAPNTSTSLICWTTASVLPIYKKYFVETNWVAPSVNVAPNMNEDNFWFYKEYVNMDLNKVIDMMSEAIYPWIDQSISFEWIIDSQKTSPAQLYWYYMKAHKQWIKTIYYVRWMSLEVKECLSCSW